MSLFEEFKLSISNKENTRCADCGSCGTGWACVIHGIYLCGKCSGVHRELDIGISYVKSLTMDSWSIYQINLMVTGGNKRFRDFMNNFEMAPDISIHEKYSSEAAIHYRLLLKSESEYRNISPLSLISDDKPDKAEESTPDTSTSSWLSSTRSYFSSTISKVSSLKSNAFDLIASDSLSTFKLQTLSLLESSKSFSEKVSESFSQNIIEPSKSISDRFSETLSSASLQSLTTRSLEAIKEVKSIAVEKARTIYTQDSKENKEEDTEMIEMKSFNCIRFN